VDHTWRRLNTNRPRRVV